MTDNQTLIGKSLKYFNQAYAPFVYKAFIKEYHESALEKIKQALTPNTPDKQPKAIPTDYKQWDTQIILTLITRCWNEVFSKFDFLGSAEKNYFFELRHIRNKWAHQLEFNSDDTYRALDTIERLLKVIGASEYVQKVYKFREWYLFKMVKEIKKMHELKMKDSMEIE